MQKHEHCPIGACTLDIKFFKGQGFRQGSNPSDPRGEGFLQLAGSKFAAPTWTTECSIDVQSSEFSRLPDASRSSSLLGFESRPFQLGTRNFGLPGRQAVHNGAVPMTGSESLASLATQAPGVGISAKLMVF